MMDQSALLLLAHGSKQSSWREPFEQVAQSLQKAWGTEKVQLAYLELSAPFFRDKVIEMIGQGITHLKIFPLFMSMGGHLARDIPREIQKIRDSFPHVKMEILEPLGGHKLFWEGVQNIAFQYLKEEL